MPADTFATDAMTSSADKPVVSSIPRPRQRAAAPPRAEGAVAVFERRQFERALGATIVPAVAWQKLEDLDALLARVNALYDEAGAEIAQAREQGHAAGFAEGLARAQSQMTEQLAVAQRAPRARARRGVGAHLRTRLRDRRAHRARFRRRKRGAAAGAAGGGSGAGRTVPADPRASVGARQRRRRSGRGAPGASGGRRDRTGRRRQPGSRSAAWWCPKPARCAPASPSRSRRSAPRSPAPATRRHRHERAADAADHRSRRGHRRREVAGQCDGRRSAARRARQGAVDRARRPRRRGLRHADPRHRPEGHDRRALRTAQSRAATAIRTSAWPPKWSVCRASTRCSRRSARSTACRRPPR